MSIGLSYASTASLMMLIRSFPLARLCLTVSDTGRGSTMDKQMYALVETVPGSWFAAWDLISYILLAINAVPKAHRMEKSSVKLIGEPCLMLSAFDRADMNLEPPAAVNFRSLGLYHSRVGLKHATCRGRSKEAS
jgi:hypothetical protein